MDKREAIGGIFRGLLTGGSWMRLAMWAKHGNREIVIHLSYQNGQANWVLRLEEGGSSVFEGSGATLEEVTILAVAALGKSL